MAEVARDEANNEGAANDNRLDLRQQGAGPRVSQNTSDTANLIPFVGGAKMMAESAKGQDVSGRTLSGAERITHGAKGAASLALDTTGVGEAEKGAVAAARAKGGAGAARTATSRRPQANYPTRNRAQGTVTGSKGGEAPVEYRVNMLKTISFIGMGVGLDICDFVLGITGVGEIADEVIDGIADIVIPTTAWLYGIPLGGKKADQKLQTILFMEVAKLIPLVNILPEYTYETWKLIDYTRQEDRERAQETAKKNAEQDRIQMQRMMQAAQVRQQQLARIEEQQAANDAAEEDVERAA